MMMDNHYNKKMNLTDDPCSWAGWELLCRTADAYTMVILLRRNCPFVKSYYRFVAAN